MGMDEMVLALHEGRMDFNQFLRCTLPRWERLAARLLARWRHPPSFTPEDMLQELVLGIWRAATRRDSKRWDPARGTPLKTFVLWSACADAKRRLHRERGAVLHGNPGAHPSRYALALTSLQRVDDEGRAADVLDLIAHTAGDQDEEAAREYLRAKVGEVACTERGRSALRYVVEAEGDVGRAAQLWYADAGERLRWEMDSVRDAERMVRSDVRRTVESYAVKKEVSS